MADGLMGQFLHVDLSKQSARTIPAPQWLAVDFVGGKGFGAKLIFDLSPAGTNPLAPEIPIMFMTGPLTATAAPAMRACVVTKSPLSGTYLDSFFGGRFGPEIKYAGYDGLIVVGKSEKPVYLWINDDQIEFRSAESIWGQDALCANALIKEDLGEPEARVATIGQAGENLVRFALVCCEYNRQAGRGGAGAVMGSKNLKGIAVKGSRLVKVFDPERFQEACLLAKEDIAANEECATLTECGTSAAVPWSSAVGTLPYKNFREQQDPKADALGDEGQKKYLFLAKSACFGCPIRCSQMGAVRTGKYAHTVTDTVEYESAALMGSNLDIHDIRAVAYMVKLCDQFGMDSMSTGVVIGFAFEAARNGSHKTARRCQARLRKHRRSAKYLIEAIALKRGELGKLLSKGVKRASEILDRGSQDYAPHVKGLELPAWGPRGTPGMGLAYMTADRGACHQRGFPIKYEVGGEPYKGKEVDPHTLVDKAEMLIKDQNYLAGTDALGQMRFRRVRSLPEKLRTDAQRSHEPRRR